MVARLLLKRGAQVNMQGMRKETPCYVILFYVYGYVKEDIIMSMAGKHAGDAQGDSLLCYLVLCLWLC